MTQPNTPQHGAGTYQMLWDCRFCGTQKLLGVTHRHCPNCGAAQDPEWRYFPAEEDLVALEDHKYVGADKTCPACGQPNSAANAFCTECGADLSGAKTVETQGVRDIGRGIAETDTRRDVVKEKFQAEMAGIKAAGPAFMGLRKKEWWIIGGVIAAALLVVAAVFALTYRKDAKGTVSNLTWARTIEIESFQQLSDADWRDQMPGDAYNTSCHQKQRTTRQVETGSHQECRDVDQGDGSMRRECKTVKEYKSEPVYDTWCSYKIDRWRTARKVESKGAGKTPAPTWPAFTLKTSIGRYGQEREGTHHEKYTVVVRESGGDTHSCDFNNQATWDRFTINAAVTLQLKITGKPDCDTLKLATG